MMMNDASPASSSYYDNNYYASPASQVRSNGTIETDMKKKSYHDNHDYASSAYPVGSNDRNDDNPDDANHHRITMHPQQS